MQKVTVNKVVILGGGSAGWMAAALLSKLMGSYLSITLIESDAIGTVGVGEATIPPIALFNQSVGLDEAAFLKATQGTIKLGIQFENWGQCGDSYMHAFGDLGRKQGLTDFHHFWMRAKAQGDTSSLWDYSFNYQAAKAGKFQPIQQIKGTPLGGLTHAYHFDAGLYANMLRKISERQGVKRIEGKVADTRMNPANGFIEALVLENGQVIDGDLFIDCSGFHGVLIEGALKTGFEDWRHWLPCDSALAVPCEKTGPVQPYTRSIAHDAGWQWRIPLQHRTGNGHVYASSYISDQAAADTLLANLDGKPLAEPRLLRFSTGRRRLQWHRNCVSLGLASGFLEPLESTSLHLVQSGVVRLLKLFPHQGIKQADVDEYNRQSRIEFERIRDFIILHYHLNQRADSRFWRERRDMAIPDSLAHKMALFKATGRVFREQDELFTEVAWHQVLIGQNFLPEDFDPMAMGLSAADLNDFLSNLRTIFSQASKQLLSHDSYLAKAGAAAPEIAN